ncbi:MAG: GntR family transcriptional regulator [Gemmatimonadetes bacterium]|nr:GntR family transcriptional regulator [Gemmatimonadota bacterium]
MTRRRRQAGGGPETDRSSQVYARLRDLIVRLRLAPGARITETDAAGRLGVSRTPVRAALQRLTQEGYVVVSDSGRRRRPVVAPLTREDATELLHIVAEVEGLAARYAASLNPKLRAQLGAELRRVNEELRRAAQARRPDANQVFELDHMFHRRLVEAAAGSRLLSLHEAIKPQAERYGRVYAAALTDEISTSVEEHAQLIQAVEAGDPDGAQRAVLAATRLSHVIDAMGERGSW